MVRNSEASAAITVLAADGPEQTVEMVNSAGGEMVGFERECHLRKTYYRAGQWRDSLVYARLRDPPDQGGRRAVSWPRSPQPPWAAATISSKAEAPCSPSRRSTTIPSASTTTQ